MDNANSADYLLKIKNSVIENLSRTKFAPSAQMQDVPRDSLGAINDDLDDELDDLDEDEGKDVRHTARRWDRYVENEGELSESEDEEGNAEMGVVRQPGVKRRRNIMDYQNLEAAADDGATPEPMPPREVRERSRDVVDGDGDADMEGDGEDDGDVDRDGDVNDVDGDGNTESNVSRGVENTDYPATDTNTTMTGLDGTADGPTAQTAATSPPPPQTTASATQDSSTTTTATQPDVSISSARETKLPSPSGTSSEQRVDVEMADDLAAEAEGEVQEGREQKDAEGRRGCSG